ncbi:MAG: 3-hydroxyisobutyrate dehydrogenase [Pseudomonadota bacterium]
MRVGFIGLGKMGAPMAQNLAAAGYDVRGFDAATAAPASVKDSQSIKQALQDCSFVLTMLPDGQTLSAVISEALAHLANDTIVIDCSTVDVATTRRTAQLLTAAGHHPLDAPVSGGTAGAVAGTLTFMVGGEDSTVCKATPLLEAMGSRVFHCGGSGSGQAAKICNNMILGISMIATCEAFTLADALGLDRKALFDVVSASSGQSWSMTTYCPVPGIGPNTPADNDYRPGFATNLMLKDLGLSQQAARSAGATTPLGAHAQELYAQFSETTETDMDFSAILMMLAKGAKPTGGR